MKEKVVIGSDHAGFPLKEKIKKIFSSNYQFIDEGADGETSVDYPIYAEKVAQKVAHDASLRGILVCGSGIGVSIAANKVPGVRAALCYNKNAAMLSRQHNDANVLAIPGREGTVDDPVEIVKVFLETDFSGEERHVRRVEQISEIEKKYEKI